MRSFFAAAAWLFGVAAVFFGWLFYSMYWQYRGLFNEQGRYFDGVVVHHDETFVLIVPAGICLLLAAVFGTLRRLRQEPKVGPKLGGA